MGSKTKLNALSAAARDIAQVFFASMFIGPMVSGVSNAPTLFSGILLSIGFWYLSVGLAKE